MSQEYLMSFNTAFVPKLTVIISQESHGKEYKKAWAVLVHILASSKLQLILAALHPCPHLGELPENPEWWTWTTLPTPPHVLPASLPLTTNLSCKIQIQIQKKYKYKKYNYKNRSWLSSVQSRAWLCTVVACIQTSSSSLLACKKDNLTKMNNDLQKILPHWFLHCAKEY